MWRAVLFADIAWFSWADMDRDFGPYTASATAQWQRDHVIGDDGIVGRITRGVADENLWVYDVATDGSVYAYYDGRYYYGVTFHIRTDSRYDMNLAGEWHGVWYSTANFSHC